jgi:hypothetical protein
VSTTVGYLQFAGMNEPDDERAAKSTGERRSETLT